MGARGARQGGAVRRRGDQPRACRYPRPHGSPYLPGLRPFGAQQAERLRVSAAACRLAGEPGVAGGGAAAARPRRAARAVEQDDPPRRARSRQHASRDRGGGRRAAARGPQACSRRASCRRARLRHEVPAARARLGQAAGDGGGCRDRPPRARRMRRLALAAVIAALFAAAMPARADGVDMLLVLAADVSRSIDDGEFELQRKGYAGALGDPRVLKAITGGPNQAIALSYVEWSGAGEQKTVVDWTTIHDGEDAAVVASAILAAPRSFLARTSISEAIDFSSAHLAVAPVAAERKVIDISGDGTSNSGRPVTDARDEALARGITINGLAIINTKAGPGFFTHTQPPGGLPSYYKENVIGGPGAFLLVVENFETFSEAMTRKLISEIAGTLEKTRTAASRPF